MPICNRCMHLEDSPEQLAQHVQAVRRPRRRPRTSTGRGAGHISLFTPLDPATDFQPRDPLKQFTIPTSAASRSKPKISTPATPRPPAWMSLLPSNVNSHIKPASPSVIQRRLTFPYSQPNCLSPPDSITPGTSIFQSEYALTLSTAVQGIEEERRRVSASTPYLPTRSVSSPKSWAVEGGRHRRHLRIDQETTLPDFRNLSPSMHETHQASVTSPLAQDEAISPRRRMSISSLKIPKRRQSIKRFSTTSPHDAYCTKAAHTPLPDQIATPAKPPFFKELSSFLGARVGRYILPSRVTESRQTNTHPTMTEERQTNVPSCSICGAETALHKEWSPSGGSMRKATAVLGEVLCESCKVSEYAVADWV